MIPEERRKYLAEELARKLLNPVRLVVFTQEYECPYCAQTRSLLGELAGLSDKLSVEVYDFVADADEARAYSRT
jgi:glutaredoxin